ncbi:MAG: hypothetical protein A2087_01580 [Spirochaetes bacterium GWD1_61_31]|nr:MAG: hypothetical protein A2Y37_12480 [Spirochaetes bacterium GWB1_60_80]OHD30185.1 MAG: hypothetical protein A2004_14345 [Spirochaetes bacterium GWC1_61_12]OHD35884.1 MAG: hypothetical protein A2087_01580 [Spirochaetes bacterium GWD1_61_31]OHD42155.1 MAG: hypothetical protein A2Y35_06455 [Spirochaetes bacterium GWE1_60_18]OHD59431.1 MAG: hypothetical protein A2Y32_09895 [Spirochaetes bacterium GWF1_60_12]HAP44056.1 hypothetical protein [Spirochaetaceae bacterium]
MNQDQVKELLLRIEGPKTEFRVQFSGKTSPKVNGLYKPLSREILIHNKNFQNDNQLVYTAIHEYAHHLHSELRPHLPGARSHTNEYWNLFHGLLDKAESLGLYHNVFADDQDFSALTSRIRQLLPQNGELMLNLGALIIEAEQLCRQKGVRFEDYLDRVLNLPRLSATAAMKASAFQVPADLGWDAMKLVAGIRQPESRSAAIDAFRAGKSPDTVKAMLKKPAPGDDDPRTHLERERQRLERTIQTLQARLDQVENQMASLGDD